MMRPTISKPTPTPAVVPTELAHAGQAGKLGVGQAVLKVGHVKVLLVEGGQAVRVAVGMGQLVVGQTGGGTLGQEGSFVLLIKSGWTSTGLEPLNLQ